MLDIHVGAPVSCADGDAGEVYAVIIDPVKDTMTHIVVRGRERRHKTERLVPIAVIADATTDQVRLSCTLAELMAMDSFTQTHYIDHSGQQNYMMGQTSGQFIQPYTTDMRAVDDQIQVEAVPPGALAVHRGFPVEATDGHVGEIGEFIVQPGTGHVTHIVLQEGHL